LITSPSRTGHQPGPAGIRRSRRLGTMIDRVVVRIDYKRLYTEVWRRHTSQEQLRLAVVGRGNRGGVLGRLERLHGRPWSGAADRWWSHGGRHLSGRSPSPGGRSSTRRRDAEHAGDHEILTEESPQVDVLIPTHGRSPYLRDAIESVVNQTYRSWRLTISENGPVGSPLAESLRPYLSDPRIRLVATGRDVGAAQNAADLVSSATARHVGLLHDDDLWDPTFLERRVAFLDAHPTCGLVFSGCRVIDAFGAEVFRTKPTLAEGLQPRRAFLRRLYRSNLIVIPTVLVPRSVYRELGSLNATVLFYDYEMWLRIASSFDVGYLACWDAAYRVHAKQTTYEQSPRLGELRLRLLDEVDERLPRDISAFDRRRARASALLHVAVDALGRGELRQSAAALVSAFRTYPLVGFDPKVVRSAVRSVWSRRRIRRAWLRTPR
jgi:glycosyltransferase involved in cell wall biosynthesis